MLPGIERGLDISSLAGTALNEHKRTNHQHSLTTTNHGKNQRSIQGTTGADGGVGPTPKGGDRAADS